MNSYEQRHRELKEKLAMLGIFDSETETREIKVTPVILRSDDEQEQDAEQTVLSAEESN